MRKLFAAIAKALRAMARTTWRWCQDTGRWLLERVPDIGGGGGIAEPELPQDLQHFEAAGAEPDGVTTVKECARWLLKGGTPDPKTWGRLTTHQSKWLAAMAVDEGMLAKVANASAQDLRAHMRGIRNIRGVLDFDPASVEQYVAAWEQRQAPVEQMLDLEWDQLAASI